MSLKDKMAGAMMDKMSPEEKAEMMSAMMEKFFANMSAAEKQQMMSGMMDKFMASMTPDEKQKMMGVMMPKMMGGEGGPMPGMMKGMMGMMKGMMGGGGEEDGKGGMPWDMCREMMSRMRRSAEMSAFATPEVRHLFDEWSEQIEGEILARIQETHSSDAAELASHFKLSEESIAFFLTRLAQKGKINLKAEKAKA